MKKYGKIFSLIMIVALMMINSLWVLGAEGENLGSWETLASMTGKRTRFGIAEVNGKIYLVGGADPNSPDLNIVEEYDPQTNIWTTKANMPTGRSGLGVAVLNGKIYAIGGYTRNGLVATVEEYDTQTNTWTSKASISNPRHYLNAVAVNDKIYVLGGIDNTETLSTVEEYNPETNTWVIKESMLTSRADMGTIALGNKIYAIGGVSNSQGPHNQVEEYDVMANTWQSKANISIPKRGIGVATLDGKIYAVGGSGDFTYYNTVEVYNPDNNSWKAGVSLSTVGRTSIGTINVNGKIYTFGGKNNDGEADSVEVYTPSVSIEAPINLTATASNSDITLYWDTVNDVDSYTILRSTTSGVIDTVIASNITGTTYTDTNVTPGVTYYYVVRTVKNGVESADSNIASAMVEINNNRALLLIKLLDENDKEYDLPISEVDTFMTWYFDRGIGQGPAYYTFAKDYNTGPYISRKDYISYDKIICIEVNEYTK
ncbi:hypothetical protein HZI73_19680 [Vallitalea pronyensis]|uniref:Fibronectin type-III domain-containing protein n=1 Tax=Vallitalea pronyensis TaxID=1348613 RepID=A0A8J8MMU7_9FIRM|nr:fibronectin type III domain-containing protein [Vallitalea pronyensis]QUI24379.1 hypothetical protein HZI73_19680 [Vallitalea pronyensis]